MPKSIQQPRLDALNGQVLRQSSLCEQDLRDPDTPLGFARGDGHVSVPQPNRCHFPLPYWASHQEESIHCTCKGNTLVMQSVREPDSAFKEAGKTSTVFTH